MGGERSLFQHYYIMTIFRFCKIISTIIFFNSLFPFCLPVRAQYLPEIQLEVTGHTGSGGQMPFWMVSNQHGKYSLDGTGAMAGLRFISQGDTTREWNFAYGLEALSRLDNSSKLWIQQGWAELNYRQLIRLRAGIQEETFGNEYSPLSTGSVIWSGNARPLPKLEMGTAGFVNVPFTDGLFQIKGSLAHGWFEKDRYVENVWLHQKYAAARTRLDFPLNFYFAYHHFAHWGGDHPVHGKLPTDLNSYLKVFFIRKGDEDSPHSWQLNRFGNHIGSRHYGIDWEREQYEINFYFQDVYEDGSGGRMKNYPDGLWGMVWKNKKNDAPLLAVLYEYLQTTDQSGPMHDRELSLGGDDNYFNHGIYHSGWTHYRMTIGTPFITSPLFNQDIDHPSNIRIWNNRVRAHHFGVEGFLFKDLSYRMRMSYSKNEGIYASNITVPEVFSFDGPRYQWSWRTDWSYRFERQNITATLSVAGDKGSMYGDNLGVMLGMRYRISDY
ncbi:MAG: hypothetical protein EA361_19780 [Bacteroidetes bacterium]|nr:MAG: hypothetical protein EA361_19780 [Bacteroidota bacterium]